MTSPHPLTDRYLQMRRDRLRRRLSFLAGVMFGAAIFCFWMALSNGASLPVTFPGITLSSEPAGIDI
jgi:hypothetical protein